MSAPSPRPYGGRSAEQRRVERRGKLIDAALDVMAANEWRAITVDKICATAGLNKRYFYESFPDLDAVAAAAVDDIAAGVSVVTLSATAATAAEPLERQAAAAVGAVVRHLVTDPRRARVLLGGVAASPPLHRHRATVMRGLTSVLVANARSVHGVELESDPLAEVAPAFVIGGTAEAILAYVDGRARVSLEELVDSLTTLWLITGNGAADVARSRLQPTVRPGRRRS
ncbi:TetR/AcrR family transcriptional regulator [Mycobacterium sp. pV006]|uniref:TetR/AcrR family transcriptional regulator n=1 Tax=Mycobacterium sp. pV006 TaxID=3238983 RepID=UPI00351B5D93